MYIIHTYIIIRMYVCMYVCMWVKMMTKRRAILSLVSFPYHFSRAMRIRHRSRKSQEQFDDVNPWEDCGGNLIWLYVLRTFWKRESCSDRRWQMTLEVPSFSAPRSNPGLQRGGAFVWWPWVACFVLWGSPLSSKFPQNLLNCQIARG